MVAAWKQLAHRAYEATNVVYSTFEDLAPEKKEEETAENDCGDEFGVHVSSPRSGMSRDTRNDRKRNRP